MPQATAAPQPIDSATRARDLAVIKAIQQRDLDGLQQLVGAHPELVLARDISGYDAGIRGSLLLFAVLCPWQQVRAHFDAYAATLVEAGAPFDHPGEMVADMAVQSGLVKTVRAMLAKGLDANAQATSETGAFHPLIVSATDPAVVVALCDAGADINAVDHHGRTLLATVCATPPPEHPHAVVDILKLGADPTIAAKQGQTPLHRVVSRAQLMERAPEELEALCDAGAKVDPKDNEGRTPLCRAAGHVDLVHILLERGANVHELDRNGDLPLHFHIKRGANNTAVILARAGAPLDVPDYRGESALELCAKGGKSELIAPLQAARQEYDAEMRAAALKGIPSTRGRRHTPTL